MKRLVVLDTNCLVQMLSVHSPYRAAWQAFREGKYELCVTDDIVDEYEEIIERVANAAVATTSSMPSYAARSRGSLLRNSVSVSLSKTLTTISLWIAP